MSQKTKKPLKRSSKRAPANKRSFMSWLISRPLWQKIGLFLTAHVMLFTACSYGVAQWYINKHEDQPLRIGATFVPRYARYFGLDPKETLNAMITELDIDQLRLVSYWDDMEPAPGKYNFEELDWQFKMAEANNVDVSLAIGLRQPRWPECHMPVWASTMPMSEWEVHLKEFMRRVIERYKDSPVLKSYQLENEFFLDVFGICIDHSRDRLIREYEFVKSLDTTHPVTITRSNNALGIPIGQPQPDRFGVSVYKRVWDKTITKRYFEYPLPSWFYASLAGYGEIVTGKDLILHELQTEAWLPDTGQFMMNDIGSIPEQNKSLDAKRLEDRIEYGVNTGMKSVDLWGAEWWYWRKQKADDPSLWNTAITEIKRHKIEDASN